MSHFKVSIWEYIYCFGSITSLSNQWNQINELKTVHRSRTCQAVGTSTPRVWYWEWCISGTHSWHFCALIKFNQNRHSPANNNTINIRSSWPRNYLPVRATEGSLSRSKDSEAGAGALWTSQWISRRGLLYQMSEHFLLEKDSAPWSYVTEIRTCNNSVNACYYRVQSRMSPHLLPTGNWD